MKNENRKATKTTGVTMVALVVTLIVMLILAGVTISMITSSGILDNAESSSSQYEISDEQETISVAFATVFSKAMTTDSKITADDLQKELDKTGRETTVTVDPDDETQLNVKFDKTNNQHSVDTETGKIDYLGSYLIDDEVETTLSGVTFQFTPSITYYTNTDITVKIENTMNDNSGDYVFEYRIGSNGTWTEYTGEVTITENTVLYARVRYLREVTAYGTYNITNIDKTAPVVATALNTDEISYNSFTLSITLNDEISGLSKIVWYYYRPQDSSWQSVTDTYTEINSSTQGITGEIIKTHSFSELTTGGAIQVYAIAYDVAGNGILSYSESDPLTFETAMYTISYDANGGSGVPSDQYAYYNHTVTVDFSTTPTLTNSVFLGWSTSSSATAATYTSDGTTELTVISDITLYAVWHTHTTACYHTHSGNSSSGGDCYTLAGCSGSWTGVVYTRGTWGFTGRL